MKPLLFQCEESYPQISFDDALLSNLRHAAHCCIYSSNPFPLFKGYECKAYVSMQMRFDGRIGFPGGYTDNKNDCDVISGLNRELVEEINLDKKYFVSQDDYLFSNVYKERNMCLHFYKKEVSVEEFLEIEKNALSATDYGKEVLGMIRVPLFAMTDGIRGFLAFLSNNFAGNAKYQLLNFLENYELMTHDDLKESFDKSQL